MAIFGSGQQDGRFHTLCIIHTLPHTKKYGEIMNKLVYITNRLDYNQAHLTRCLAALPPHP